eukprot:TRINITY_DN770_c0_g1_i1.p1 TRINITY_DN770_c0_g1~~TRINITY_DN770_c0_g1_i1.p1  ORF type:complete len:143 (+),score=31.60 TRINITY_DN770_c0_g1_i1:229-657(+)
MVDMARDLMMALALFAGIAAYLASPPNWPWFAWHPAAMLVGFFPLAGSAILFKKQGGYTNTKLHGVLMAAAVAASLFGWYVIWSNKEMSGKLHNTSWHAWGGLLCLGIYGTLALVGVVALHPDFGILTQHKAIRCDRCVCVS